MKKVFIGICASLVFSASIQVTASQHMSEEQFSQLEQEIQQQYQSINLTEQQTTALLTLKADLQRYNNNVAAVHGSDEHSLNVLQQFNQDRYRQGVNKILTEEQKHTLLIERRAEMYAQVSAPDMARFKKEVRDEGRVMKLSRAEKDLLLDLKVDLSIKLSKTAEEFTGNQKAQNEASRVHFDAYMTGLKQLITPGQLNTLNAWRSAGMPEDFEV